MKRLTLLFRSDSAEATIALGRSLGQHLGPGDGVGLAGELGSGKTWFTKGLALGLDVDPHEVVTSPTFALLNEYEGRCPFYHLDVYRLSSLEEFSSAGLEEYLCSEGVAAMEWADRWPQILPPHWIMVHLRMIPHSEGPHGPAKALAGDVEREISISGSHSRSVGILERLRPTHPGLTAVELEGKRGL